MVLRISELTPGAPPITAESLIEVSVAVGSPATSYDSRRFPVSNLFSTIVGTDGEGVIPASQPYGLAITYNYNAVSEVDFWALHETTGPIQEGGFQFWQKRASPETPINLAYLYGDNTFSELDIYTVGSGAGVATFIGTFNDGDSAEGFVGTGSNHNFAIYVKNENVLQLNPDHSVDVTASDASQMLHVVGDGTYAEIDLKDAGGHGVSLYCDSTEADVASFNGVPLKLQVNANQTVLTLNTDHSSVFTGTDNTGVVPASLPFGLGITHSFTGDGAVSLWNLGEVDPAVGQSGFGFYQKHTSSAPPTNLAALYGNAGYAEFDVYTGIDDNSRTISISVVDTLGQLDVSGGIPLLVTLGNTPVLTLSAGDLSAVFAGSVTQKPPASITPANNGDLAVQATSNTSLTFKYKGSDGVVRSASLTLA